MKNIKLKLSANGENKIEFNDKSSRMNNVLFKIYPFLFLIFGVYQIYSGLTTGQEIRISRIISGAILLSLLIITYHSNFIRTNRKEIRISEIKNVKMKKIFGGILIDFKLKDNSTRRVYNIKNITDWEILKNQLTERKVNCLN